MISYARQGNNIYEIIAQLAIQLEIMITLVKIHPVSKVFENQFGRHSTCIFFTNVCKSR